MTTLLGACSGASGEGRDFSPIPEPITTATLSGPRCQDGACTCRTLDLSAGLPDEPDRKRFEFIVGPADNELWVMVGDMVLYKSYERAKDCFYIDLPPGKHPVKLRAKGSQGFAARLTVLEMGKLGEYDTLEFICGGPGLCEVQTLKNWQASLATYKRNAHDPCGSTKIRDLRWNSGPAPNRVHPLELELDFVLDVYRFEPKRPSGHPACKDKF
ncbi:MAG: hypothetical protein AAGC55_12340 [Myxococcota bacterium]